ncbi:hypothetical protein [Sphingobacterium deserti]|nr:hypothetical protein [Sphingobacterium deserti]
MVRSNLTTQTYVDKDVQKKITRVSIGVNHLEILTSEDDGE